MVKFLRKITKTTINKTHTKLLSFVISNNKFKKWFENKYILYFNLYQPLFQITSFMHLF